MTVLDGIPIDRISADARQVHLGRLLVTMIVAVFFGIGWVASKVWLGCAFAGVAVKAGWLEARTPPPPRL